MSKKIFIDASHSEETRVALLDEEGRLEDYDIESIARKLLKGNVFLAKVTRVEPSLQAAFVDYGGNRHGFLPFSEIHPDYYRIPIADKEALMKEEAELRKKLEEAADAEEDGELDPEDAAKLIAELTGDDSQQSAQSTNNSANNNDDGDDAKAETKTKTRRRAPKKKDLDTAAAPTDAEDASSDSQSDNATASADVANADGVDGIDATDETAETVEKKPARGRPRKTASKTPRKTTSKPTTKSAKIDQDTISEDIDGDDADDKNGNVIENHDEADSVNGNVAKNHDDSAEGNSSDANSGDSNNSDSDDDNQGNDKRNSRNNRNRGRSRGGRGRGRGGRSSHNSANSQGNDQNTHGSHKGSDSHDDDDFSSPSQPLWSKIRRNYKIQEVIKRGQIMLIQINKEERGNKGAAVTSYITLPGRYCVLMPNSSQGGGVSRKIQDRKERKRMRDTLKSLGASDGMSVILRTAGLTRTKLEIKRDYTYLTRVWNSIRELTLKSSAPAQIHEEGNLLHRIIRDVYSKDYDGITVAGEKGYKEMRNFMKMMMPSHVKKVQEYTDPTPLFIKHNIEKQIEAVHDTTVQLKSGGYLVINPTEALVSIDVNSGRSTSARHIEETALKTNLEAAEEVARQMRLRDLAGLVVIDFIDMENRKNNRQVERVVQKALSKDRAKVQCSQISNFGLMELSRQRLRPSMTEKNFTECPHCHGKGIIRTVDGAALTILRAIENEGVNGSKGKIAVEAPSDVLLFVLNQKRDDVSDMEKRYGFKVTFEMNDEMGGSDYTVTAEHPTKQAKQNNRSNNNNRNQKNPRHQKNSSHNNNNNDKDDQNASRNNDSSDKKNDSRNDHNSDEQHSKSRRGRRGGRGRNENNSRSHDDNQNTDKASNQTSDQANTQSTGQTSNDTPSSKTSDDQQSNVNDKPRRGRRSQSSAAASQPNEDAKSNSSSDVNAEAKDNKISERAEKPKRTPRGRKKEADKTAGNSDTSSSDTQNTTQDASNQNKEDKPSSRAKKPASKKVVDMQDAKSDKQAAPKSTAKTDETKAKEQPKPEPEYNVISEASDKKKKGWWSRMMEK